MEETIMRITKVKHDAKSALEASSVRIEFGGAGCWGHGGTWVGCAGCWGDDCWAGCWGDACWAGCMSSIRDLG